ncbi:MAG: class I SAM-dependent methyltransferase [Betaproteobacteria bacterium]|nr:class I SAM-dependent methyltransferase [Betaproteobacteria bacterium]
MSTPPSQSLPFTGERFTPECDGEIWHEHWHRYLLAARLCAGRRVLDVACGEGYGTAFLAKTAAHVTGADIDEQSISHAAERYGGQENVQFVQASASRLPLATACIDVIVSFETVEHLMEQEEMIAEFARVLTPDGVLVLSSPNRPMYSEVRNYRNPFHVKELDREGLERLLFDTFPAAAWFGQRLNLQSTIWALDAHDAGAELLAQSHGSGEPEASKFEVLYYLVVAAKSFASLPQHLPSLSCFTDANQAAYEQYKEYYVQAMHQRAEIADLRLRLEDAASLVSSMNSVGAQASNLGNSEGNAGIEDEARRLRSRLEFRESWWGWLRFPAMRLRVTLNRLFSGTRS